MFITEFFVPLFTNKPLFGSFRKAPEQRDLTDKIKDAEEKIEHIKSVQKEADDAFKKSQEIKQKTDTLLNK
jgi:membrane-associated HD superfamily phosphohydrolase